jgi:hypothetical protein
MLRLTPSYTAFLTALEEDPELGDLFPDDDEERGRIRAHRPSSLPATLINAALWDSVMDGDGSAAAIESSLRAKLACLHRRRGRTRSGITCGVKGPPPSGCWNSRGGAARGDRSPTMCAASGAMGLRGADIMYADNA